MSNKSKGPEVTVVSQGPPTRSIVEILQDPPTLQLDSSMRARSAVPEVYFSIDIEADGPIPGQNSMLSLGCGAFVLDTTKPDGGTCIATFNVNLELLSDAHPDDETMAWWNQSRHKAAYAATRVNPRPPYKAIPFFVDWVNNLTPVGSSAVCVGYPITYDFMFLYWYMQRFRIPSPFSFSALDIKTLGMVLMKTGFRSSTK